MSTVDEVGAAPRSEERGGSGPLVSETCEVQESEVAVSPVVDANSGSDDEGIGEEIFSSHDENLDKYLKDTDELVMSSHANVSDQTEVPRLGSLDANVPVRADDPQPVPLGTGTRNSCTEGGSRRITTSREGAT